MVSFAPLQLSDSAAPVFVIALALCTLAVVPVSIPATLRLQCQIFREESHTMRLEKIRKNGTGIRSSSARPSDDDAARLVRRNVDNTVGSASGRCKMNSEFPGDLSTKPNAVRPVNRVGSATALLSEHDAFLAREGTRSSLGEGSGVHLVALVTRAGVAIDAVWMEQSGPLALSMRGFRPTRPSWTENLSGAKS